MTAGTETGAAVALHVPPHHGFPAAYTHLDLDRALAGIEGAMEEVKGGT